MSKNIAITGEGIISSIGTDCKSVLNSLLEGKTGIGAMQYLESVHKDLPVGEVKLTNEEMREMSGIHSEMVSRTTLMAILSIKEALASANIPSHKTKDKPFPRIVLISGTTVGGMDITEKYFNQLETFKGSRKCLLQHDCGSSTKYISHYFGIFQSSTTISTACSSAANAIILGAEILKNGDADIVVAGGCESLSKFHLNGFNSLMILDHEKCRPFDETHAGLNLGEGAAYIVMETEDNARLRNHTPHAYLNGYANTCDAFHQTASSDNGEGAYLAMTQALNMANLKPDDIQYINAHGTGTPNNDQSESCAIKRVFNNNIPPVSSTKSFTGHTTSASGSIEAVICILSLNNGFIPGNLGWKNKMENGIIPTMGIKGTKINHILSNSFGFGGNDSSLIISSIPTASLPVNLNNGKIKTVSCIKLDSDDYLKQISQFVKPMEARRMGKLIKATLFSSLSALKEAGLTTPDAIISATAFGCIENSEKILNQICEDENISVKPTYFMQSTHNTLGSTIAIKTKCHGYNSTYTHGKESLVWAKKDAEYLLRSGKAKYVLISYSDESTDFLNGLLAKIGEKPLPMVQASAYVLTIE